MLPQDQIENVKKQLISQLDASSIPDKEEIKRNVLSMDSNQLEQFLIQNNLIKSGQQPNQKANECIFCSIISGQTHSYKIDENKDSTAVLEINPISKGHVIIIPREHIKSSDKLPKTIFSLAKKIAKKIKSKFKPKDITIVSSNLFGHEIINILPVYKNETLDSERHKAKPEELGKLHEILEKKPKPKKVSQPKIKKIDSVEKLWLPRRVP